MREIWNKIENWLSNNAPDILSKLNEGATAQEIEETEKILGIKFTEDIKESYKIHNGFKKPTGLIWGWDFLSLKEIVSEWEIWVDLIEEFEDNESTPDTGIKNDWFNIKWIPFTSNGGGDSCCIDFDPDKNGVLGQILTLWHDDPIRPLEAESFKDFFNIFANDLEAGKYKMTKYGLEF